MMTGEAGSERFGHNSNNSSPDSYVPNRRVFPESDKESLLAALQNLQIEINNLTSRKERKTKVLGQTRKNHKNTRTCLSDENYSGLWNNNQAPEEPTELTKPNQTTPTFEANRQGVLGESVKWTKGDVSYIETQEDIWGKENNTISKWEMDNIKLTLAKNLAQNKIKEIEEKLISEFKMEEDSIHTTSGNYGTSKKWRQLKHKENNVKASSSSATIKSPKAEKSSAFARHYKLNLAEIPFITGKSTGKSHSLSANFQEVLSLMKSHNTKLCVKASSCSLTHKCQCKRAKPLEGYSSVISHISTSPSVSRCTCQDSIKELIFQLTDELLHLRVKHEEMQTVDVAEGCCNQNKNFKVEIQQLEQQMEMKKDQINKLSQYQKMECKTLQKCNKLHVKSTSIFKCHSGNYKVEIKDSPTHAPQISFQNSNKQRSLELLRNLKEIQSALRADEH